jgi:hypothetical protein|eukprot:COSAG06_NODE_370_length_16728_cov_5.639004_16_plen_69_part_00
MTNARHSMRKRVDRKVYFFSGSGRNLHQPVGKFTQALKHSLLLTLLLPRTNMILSKAYGRGMAHPILR